MNIKITLTGKPKSDFILRGVERYIKWLSPYGKVQLQYLPLGGKTDRNREEVKRKESRKYIELIDSRDTIVLLHEKGEEYSSQQFARKLETWQNEGVKLSFFLGGPLGFSDEILSKDWLKLSLSRMTFTHEMAFLILLEQLYRAYSILGNKTYHY